tara:strand:- start:1590 stop:1811 length:222 start_codon:yes stop_codon:yes gene_type:complete
MSNLAKIVMEEYPKNNFAYQISSKLSATNVSRLPPPCFEEFCDLFNCLNKTGDYSKCAEKYKSFAECFNKFYK